jgi:hypothetical protein
MNIAAFIVGFNDEKKIKNCLERLSWCDKIFYYDMGSHDNSVEIAKNYATEIKIIPKFSYVELVHEKYCDEIDCDLILLIDPDEVMTLEMEQETMIALNNFDLNKHSELRANMYYYFKNKRLKGTFWGGLYSSRFIYNKKFIRFTGKVHNGIQVSNDNPLYYKWNNSSYVKHYWTLGWLHLFNKHKRYLKAEGSSMFARGLKYSTKLQLKETLNAFYFSFWAKKGIRDGLIGFLLSLFWMWYTFKRWDDLRKFEITINNNL